MEVIIINGIRYVPECPAEDCTDTDQIAKALKVTKATVINMIDDGRLPKANFPGGTFKKLWRMDNIGPYLPGGPKAPTKFKKPPTPGPLCCSPRDDK